MGPVIVQGKPDIACHIGKRPVYGDPLQKDFNSPFIPAGKGRFTESKLGNKGRFIAKFFIGAADDAFYVVTGLP